MQQKYSEIKYSTKNPIASISEINSFIKYTIVLKNQNLKLKIKRKTKYYFHCTEKIESWMFL